ncbi:purine nucleoside phosphorylase [Tepidanaerobacter acetatoxydans Re1]|uniref:Purine nucleoside phosphorylase n=1 Tax=Tepidanaerobacter acetatoxydans (strain DSM 21804 / JCM 16047 / Re1) TaxID=1209989 RepID=F4LQW5_TEPAE|nr:purine-nucleoside phosphorylase [Tepidanaerobacter acetatoxydans]AEE92118.1 inosine guanosine and xanthosine phosphorylase family [Tepidanaerobacter acetatoxydans Re1]CCP26968.1 purine nucleoside phosphorylase [Tepidanaerobacter acetatoxydans Re1]
MSYLKEVLQAVEYIKKKIDTPPKIGIILGSGLGELVNEVQDSVIIPYSDIPGFPVSTVKGHAGNLIFGKLMEKDVAVMQGRFHFYEGYPISKVVLGVRVMGLLGIETLFVTNASGGINSSLEPGDLMVIRDHINFTGENPAIGEEITEFGPRFFDMTFAYDRKLIAKAQEVYIKNEVPYKDGVYAFLKGPSYETPAEIKMLSIIGADAVGMSTVPEVIAARQMGIRVFGISCITNMAAGISKNKLSHQEVVETSQRVKEDFIKIIADMVAEI